MYAKFRQPIILTSQYSDTLTPTIPTPQYSNNYLDIDVFKNVCIDILTSVMTNSNHNPNLA